MSRLSHSDFKKDVLANPDLLKAYEDLKEEFSEIHKIIKANKQRQQYPSNRCDLPSTDL